ncbi:ftsJ-like methyltransferase family protein, partial [Vibrio parahaemolyticus V-223/04]
KISC